MIIRTLIVIGLAMLALVNDANARTAGELLNDCRLAESMTLEHATGRELRADSQQAISYFRCTEFIEGYVWAWYDAEQHGSPRSFCMDNRNAGVPWDAARRAFITYAEMNPSRRDHHASAVLYDALVDTFRCR